MKDEIKEILDKLKDGNWYNELDLTGTIWIELRWEETHLLLDYITYLEKRNKELEDGFKATTEELCEYAEENERLNNIINELEKELNQEYLVWQCKNRSYGKTIKYGIEVAREHYYKRLQELKENK